MLQAHKAGRLTICLSPVWSRFNRILGALDKLEYYLDTSLRAHPAIPLIQFLMKVLFPLPLFEKDTKRNRLDIEVEFTYVFTLRIGLIDSTAPGGAPFAYDGGMGHGYVFFPVGTTTKKSIPIYSELGSETSS